jgi:hypothetical protein
MYINFRFSISSWQHNESILIVNNGFDGSELFFIKYKDQVTKLDKLKISSTVVGESQLDKSVLF